MEVTTDAGFKNFSFTNSHPEEVKKFMGQMASQFGGGPPRCPLPQERANDVVKSADTHNKINMEKMKVESEKKEAAEEVERNKQKTQNDIKKKEEDSKK